MRSNFNVAAGLFAAMCVCVVILMSLQGKVILAVLQGIAFIVTILGYIRAKRKLLTPPKG